jgi:hypothetical protein
MNRKTRLYLLLSNEYINCINPNDDMIEFYLEIMDKLWYSFTEREIEYVEKEIRSSGLVSVSKLSTDS